MGFINKPTTGCLTLNDVGYEESRKITRPILCENNNKQMVTIG